MSQPASNQNEPSKMGKLLSGNVDNSIKARLPRGTGPAPKRVASPTESSSAEPVSNPSRYRFLPAFWTITGILSLVVNIILISILLIALQMLGAIQSTSQDQISGLLGGLYSNFVKMDQATIAANVPVDATIPLNISVPVQTTTTITLAEAATIPNAHVRINTGALNIDANAIVTLPANTPLTVNLNFQLPVQNNVPIHLDVPVNIPLNQTQLHEPFVGLQKVVEPWYCLVQPQATFNNVQVCPTILNPATQEPVTP